MNKNQNIVIIDYGMGNVGSISNMIKFVGYECEISNNKNVIEKADKLILPGVGHFKKAMENIELFELKDIIIEKVLNKKTPILGICLGMQLLCKYSEEGNANGLSFIDANVKKFDFKNSEDIKIPHMGWNKLKINNTNNILFENLELVNKFYFVHSYFVECINKKDISATTNYGCNFTSSFSKDNIFGVQFHPEKSHKFGMKLFENFLKL